MALITLERDDLFLISIEFLISIGLLISLVLALKIRSRYPNLTVKGWLEICIGLFGILLHSIFDVLDTLKWNIKDLNDILNVFDGLFFVLGLVLVGIGIMKIANSGATAWEL
ncbi:MAG: hypothetical protein ACFFAU_06070 [Candidatus Hodarchaeota archaeon]